VFEHHKNGFFQFAELDKTLTSNPNIFVQILRAVLARLRRLDTIKRIGNIVRPVGSFRYSFCRENIGNIISTTVQIVL